MNITQQTVCQDIVNLLNNMKNAMGKIAEEKGSTRIQLFAIYSVGSRGELPMGKMADVLHCDPSNVTGIVDRLVAQGVITREEYPQDRRAKLLRLTDKGSEILQAVMVSLPEEMGCDKLDETELATLHTLLQKVHAV